MAVGQNQQRVVGGSIAINADAVERPRGNVAKGLLEERGGDGGVCGHKRKGGGEIRMDHPGAFSAANEMNALARHLEERRGGLGARVRGADSERELGKRAT